MKFGRKILAALAAAILLALAAAGTWYLSDQRRVTYLNLSLADFELDPGAWPAADQTRSPSGRKGGGPGRRTAAWRDGAATLAEEEGSATALRFYSGLGLGVVQLSMDFGEPGVRWAKDKSTRKSRVFTGFTYALSRNLMLGVEYRALATGAPLFALELGGQRFELDNPFQDHLVDLKLSYAL
jgi:hypothetical protein